MPDKITQVYNAYKADGATKAQNEQQFRNWMVGDNYRRGVYDDLVKQGANVGTFEHFTQALGYKMNPKPQSKAAQQAVQYKAPQVPENFGNLDTTTAGQSWLQRQNSESKPANRINVARDTQTRIGEKVTGGEAVRPVYRKKKEGKNWNPVTETEMGGDTVLDWSTRDENGDKVANADKKQNFEADAAMKALVRTYSRDKHNKGFSDFGKDFDKLLADENKSKGVNWNNLDMPSVGDVKLKDGDKLRPFGNDESAFQRTYTKYGPKLTTEEGREAFIQSHSDEIAQIASKLHMTPDAFVNNYVRPNFHQIDEEEYRKAAKEFFRPKGYGDDFIQGLMTSNVANMIGITPKDYQDLRQEAVSETEDANSRALDENGIFSKEGLKGLSHNFAIGSARTAPDAVGFYVGGGEAKATMKVLEYGWNALRSSGIATKLLGKAAPTLAGLTRKYGAETAAKIVQAGANSSVGGFLRAGARQFGQGSLTMGFFEGNNYLTTEGRELIKEGKIGEAVKGAYTHGMSGLGTGMLFSGIGLGTGLFGRGLGITGKETTKLATLKHGAEKAAYSAAALFAEGLGFRAEELYDEAKKGELTLGSVLENGGKGVIDKITMDLGMAAGKGRLPNLRGMLVGATHNTTGGVKFSTAEKNEVLNSVGGKSLLEGLDEVGRQGEMPLMQEGATAFFSDPAVSRRTKQKVAYVLGKAVDTNVPRTERVSITQGEKGTQVVRTYSKDGELLSVDAYADKEKAEMAKENVYMKRDRDDFLVLWNDAVKPTQEESTAMFGEVARRMGESDMGVFLAKLDDAERNGDAEFLSRYEKVKDEVMSRVLGGKDKARLDVMRDVSAEYKVDLDKVLDKDPTLWKDNESDAVKELGERLKNGFADKNDEESNRAVARQDGADLSEQTELEDSEKFTESAKTVNDRVTSATAAWMETVKNTPELEEWMRSNPDASVEDMRDNFGDDVADAYMELSKAKSMKDGFIDNTAQKIEDAVQNQVEQARFTGTVDGGKSDLIYLYTDKAGNVYTLVGGDLVWDAERNRFDVAENSLLIFRDKDGNLVQNLKMEDLIPNDALSVEDYADRVRTSLQEKKTAEIQSSETPMPEGTLEGKTEADGTKGVETPSHEERSDNYKIANSLRGKIGQPLSKEEADSLVSEMEERAEPAREIELTPENWTAEFGEDGKVNTPLGEVKMGENQLAKLFMKGREAELGMIKPTLTNPDVIIEESSNAADGKEERSSSYLFVKTFMRDSKKVKFYISVTVKKDGMEVVVSNHFMNKNAVDRKLQEGKMIYIKGLSTSNSSDRHLAEHPNGVPDLLPTQENDNPSNGKDTTKSSDLQENGETLTFKDGTEVPMNEKGEPDFGKMTPEQGAELYESNFGKDAESVLADEMKDAEKALKDANKMKIKGDGWNGRLKAKEEKDAAITAAQTEIDRVEAIQKALTAKKVAEGIEKAKGVETPSHEEGSNTAGSVAAEKFRKASKIVGRKGTRTLADGTKIGGTYMLVPAESVTASHDVTNGYKKSEGFPVNGEGRTVNDRDYEHDRDAQDVTEKMSANYDGQAVNQVPTVSDEGIVYDGNGRTMAGQLAAKKGTDKEYVESLKENAEGFGFTAEDVDKIEHPRVIFVPDERLPYDTETFARFNRNEKKSQSNTQEAIANSKKLSGEDVGAIVSEMESSGSLDSFFNNPKAINSLLKTLVEKDIIGQNEVAGLKDGDLMSAKGREFVQNLLLGSVFKEDTLKMLGIEKGLKSKALNAMRQILDNAKLGEYSLREEVDKAIQLLYEAKRQGYTVEGLLRQSEMFGESASERYPIEVQIMAKALEGRVADFKELMDVYNRNAQAFNTGEADMFGEKPTKEEFINEILKLENWKKYDTRKEKQAEQSTADVRSAEGGEQKTRGNNEKGKGGEEGVKLEDPSDAEEGLIKNAEAFNGGKAKGEESPSHEEMPLNEEGEEVERKQKSENAEAPSEREKKLRDAVIDRMKENGMDVIADTEEGQRVLEMVNGGGVRMSAKKRRALETVSVSRDEKHQPTVVSSADGAKVLNNLQQTKEKYEKQSNRSNTFVGDVAKALGAERFGSGSEYATFETKNGQIVTVRLANHNAHVSGFDYNGRDNGISIVISPKPNAGITNDGNAHIVEFYYDSIKLRRAEGKPLAEIVRSIEQCLYSGEFKDATGLAERQEVNADDVARFQKVYHGSQADFDHFDHSHMGEGEGAQAYGWGTYVTEVKGIGRSYAIQNTTKHNDALRTLQHDVDAISDQLARHRNDLKYNEDQLKRANDWRAEAELDYELFQGKADDLKKEYGETSPEYQNHLFNDIYTDEMKRAQRSVKNIEEDIQYRKEKIAELEKALKDKQSEIDKLPEKFPRHLYTVEIPDDTGENYLDWNNPATDKQIDGIRKYLFENYRKQKLEAFDASISETKNAPNADEVNAWVRKGENIYKTLKELLGSDKEASKALSEIGFVGIKYPADNMRGGREDGKKNYVIFDEKDAKITNHVRFFRTAEGEAYGFTVGGKIYIDPRIADTETPIHEYAHLWASALRRGNAKEWSNVVELMKGTAIWNEVKGRYPELETDSDIADEVIAHYSGRRGAERLRKEYGGEEAKGVMARVKEALDRFWKATADMLHIHYTTAEEVADRVMKDLLDGVDPRKFKDEPEDSDSYDEGGVRFRKVEDPKEIERLEKEPKVKVYRAMQVIDGKLYPPMAAKVNGGFVEARELGEWERADENPDLAIPDIDTKTGKQKVDKKTGELKWKFKLDKGGKDAKGKKLGDINAAYNPYWHTSRSPLNDQFSSAYKRPNLKVVEVEVPESELTSGYKAERAKDAVGEMTWHSGPVSSKLPKEKERKVILSRWDKPVRVLSDAEAADRIAEMLKGEDIEIPDNTVTPGMKAELVKRGLKVKETDEVKKWNESLRFRKGDGVETPTHGEGLTPREKEQKKVMEVHRKNVVEATEKLNAKVAVHESVGDVENEAVRRAIENGENVKAWYDVRTGEVHVYLPNVTDKYDAQKSVVHEIVGHKGMRRLLGESGYREMMRRMYTHLSDDEAAEVNERMMRNGWDFYTAMDEWVADKAEESVWQPQKYPKYIGLSNLWDFIKHYVSEAMHKAGYNINPNIDDVKYWLWESKNALQNGDSYTEMKRNAFLWRMKRGSEKETLWDIVNDPSYNVAVGNDDAQGDVRLRKVSDDDAEIQEAKVLFRKGSLDYSKDDTPQETATKDAIDRRLGSWQFRETEAWKDHMASLDATQSEMKKGVKNFNSSMDVYHGAINQSSVVAEKIANFERRELNNMQQALKKVTKALGGGTRGVEDANVYIYMKSGLERNRVLLVRDVAVNIDKKIKKLNAELRKKDPKAKIITYTGIKQYRDEFHAEKDFITNLLEQGRIDLQQYYDRLDKFIKNFEFAQTGDKAMDAKIKELNKWYKENVGDKYDPNENDYSGISSIVQYRVNDKFSDKAIIDAVMKAENTIGYDNVSNLWTAVREVTGFALECDHRYGIVSSEAKDRAKSMFEWYVPMRGFKVDTMEDSYEYMHYDSGKLASSSLKTAKGRTTLAASPLGTASAMAAMAISRGEDNANRQRMYRLANAWLKEHTEMDANGDVKLTEVAPVMISDVWYEKITDSLGNESWRIAIPNITADMGAEAIRREIAAFEITMKAKQAKGGATTTRQEGVMEKPFENKGDKSQNIVTVWFGGKQRQIIFTGNPRAAQALNGELKSDAHGNALMQFMSGMFTSYNVTFSISNLSRDTLFANNNISIKEDAKYYRRFTALQARLLGSQTRGMLTGNAHEKVRGEYFNMWAHYKQGKAPKGDLEKLFYEFMDNGGKTGFVKTRTIDDYEREIRKNAGGRKAMEYVGKALHALPEVIEGLNERSENLNRFACYATSRKMGRSIMRSITDAKEVSTNFNRHGLGGKAFDVPEATWAEKVFVARAANWCRGAYMFFNAGIQSLRLEQKNFAKHKVKTLINTVGIPMVLGGYLIPLFNQWLAGDDGEKYSNLPEWDRRNNFCFYIGKDRWLKVPLPIEIRAMYGMGDVARGAFIDKRLQTETGPGLDALAQLTQVLPIDFMGEGMNPLMVLLPDIGKPVIQSIANTDWTGKPIYKDYDYMKYDPEYMKVYKGEFEPFVNLSKWINEWSGGTAVTKGSLDGWYNNPAIWSNIVQGYLGGAWNDAARTEKIVERLVTGNWKDFSARDVPMVRALYSTPTEKTVFYRGLNKYATYKEISDQYDHDMKAWKNNLDNPEISMKYNAEINGNSVEKRINALVKENEKVFKECRKIINSGELSDTEARNMQMQMDKAKLDLVDEIENMK